jgi:CHAT domain-containing protein
VSSKVMSLMKVLRDLFMLLAVLLCTVQGVRALDTPDAGETARQIAAEANDDAVSVGERQESLKKLEESVQLFLGAGEAEEAARVLNRAGRLQLKLNAPQDALDSHLRALALLRGASAVEAEVDALNGLGATYTLLKQRDRAEQVLRRAITLSEPAGYTVGQAQALLTLSDGQNYENHAVALQTAQASLALWQASGDERGLARAYSQIGVCYFAQNTLPEAAENYEKTLELWRALNNPAEQAGALIMLAFIEYRKGEWQSSISLLTQAEGLVDEDAEPEKMGQIAAGLAEAFNENGLPDRGITQYERALNYYRRTKDPHLIWYATWGLGCTYYRMGKFPEAYTYLRQALGRVTNSIEAAQCDESISKVDIATDKFPTALQNLQSALAIYQRAGNPKEEAQVRGLMAQVYQQQGRLDRARYQYRQALAAFSRCSDQVNQAAVSFTLGQLELRTGNYDAAEDYLRHSVEITEHMRRMSTSSDLIAAFSASVHERYESYIECLMRKYQVEPAQSLAVRAFESSESARARSLAELLRATETSLVPGLDPQLAEQERTLRQLLRVNEDSRISLLDGDYKKAQLVALDSELARLQAEYKQVEEIIRARYPSYEQITRPVDWNLQRIQEQVIADDQTILLEYSLGTEKSYVWAVTRNSITGQELPAQASITEAAQRVYELLATRPGADTENKLAAASRELSRMVLSPVAAQLNKRRIIVVADGALNYIPFQILPSPSAEGELMVAECEVVNAPSASILGQLRQEAARRPAPSKVLAAFGDPVFASNYAQRKAANDGEQLASVQPLENDHLRYGLRDIELDRDSFDPSIIQPVFYARQELANLRDVASGAGTLVAADFEATRERLQGTKLNEFSILHFATHGLLDPERPENSGLMLSTVNREGQSQNGLVTLQDIYNLHAPVDLVVLSACRTALGKEVRSEGLIGLTRGFMYAGASSVVSSLWKVNDEATAELMKRFYANMLQSGMTPAEALRAAQNSIRRESQWRSPHYWAAFTLQGEYRHVIKPTPASAAPVYPKAIVVGILLTLLSAVAAWWRYRHRRGMRGALVAG